jgi:hypothetical protein
MDWENGVSLTGRIHFEGRIPTKPKEQPAPSTRVARGGTFLIMASSLKLFS